MRFGSAVLLGNAAFSTWCRDDELLFLQWFMGKTGRTSSSSHVITIRARVPDDFFQSEAGGAVIR